MKNFNRNNLKKNMLSIFLAGSVLCGNAIPAYATFNEYSTNQSINLLSDAGVGEYLYKQLTDEDKKIYRAIISQIDKLETDSESGTGVTITVPTGYSISTKPVFAVFRDHPEFFWVDSSKLSWGQIESNVDGNDTYELETKPQNASFFYEGFTTENLQSYITDFNNKIKEIKDQLPTTATDDISKLKYINNWLSLNNVYNASGLGATNFSRCAASGLLSDNNISTVGDDPVCYGYATAMKVLLDAFDIENAYIEGWAYNTSNRPAGEQHAWNYVYIDDGNSSKNWYAIDPTWDDPSLSTLPARQHYFLVGQNTITEKGFTGYESFNKNHDSSEEKSPAYKEHKFTYPMLAQEARNPSASGNVVVIDTDGNANGYSTLEDAVNAANSGDTLILQNVVAVDTTINISKDITIDLNGQFTQSSNPVAINSSASPIFNINPNNSVAIINSGSFTSVSLDSDSSNIITNNGSLTLGSNMKFSSKMFSMSSSFISGNEPQYSPNTRYFATNTYLSVFLVAEPKQPENQEFTAQDNYTVQNLLDAFSEPSITLQYYNETGELKNFVNNNDIHWDLKQSPSGSNNINPSDPLENGNYRFEATVFGYVVPYIVEVSGISEPKQEINSVSISGIDTPTTGQALDTDLITETANVTASNISWSPNDLVANSATSYTVSFTLSAQDGYILSDNLTVTINGNAAQVTKTADNNFTVSYEFAPTEQKDINLQSIQNPSDITVPNGTALNNITLPKQVTIVTDDVNINKADVNWKYQPVDNTSYQPELKTEQKFVLQGDVILPSNVVNTNGISLVVKINITVSAAESSSGGGSSSGGSSGGGTSSTDKTETIINPDGSTTATVTKPDGTVTTTNTDLSGNQTQTVKNPDGSIITNIKNKDGSSSKTEVDTEGNSISQVTLSDENIENSSNKPVSLPIPSINTSSNSTSTVNVNLPSDDKIQVEIPVNNSNINTVAVIIKDDGTTEIIKTTLPTENGIKVPLSDGDTIKVIDNNKSFSDVSSDFWGADSICFASSREILSGTDENKFSPNTAMNRAMILTALARFDGVNTSNGSNWYDDGKNWAIDKGISDGLNMTETLTREQLVTMLYRYSGSPSVSDSTSNFKDKDKINSWAVNATIWAEQHGLITGIDEGIFNPQGEATRAQFATIIMRFIEKMV